MINDKTLDNIKKMNSVMSVMCNENIVFCFSEDVKTTIAYYYSIAEEAIDMKKSFILDQAVTALIELVMLELKFISDSNIDIDQARKKFNKLVSVDK